jgi:two-component system, LuxR family, sensor kinase FixL
MSLQGKAAVIAGFVALYVALDWVSLIEPFGPLGIAPWNPAAGLGFALLLHFGLWLAPALCGALLVADLLFRDLAASPVAMVVSAASNAAVYATTATFLRRRLSLRMDSHRDLLLLLAAGAAAATVASAAVITAFTAGGLLSPDEVPDAALHFWVGDVIGTAVLTPFVLMSLHRPDWILRPRAALEHGLQLGAIIIGLWVVFGLESQNHFEFSYVLFIPLIWIAMRDGLAGSVWGVMATQLGLMAALQLKGLEADAMTQFQILMLAVAVTGLLLGSAVDERKRAEARLKDHEAELAHAMRLATTGEMAAAIAHELNQPLTATITLARACQATLEAPSRDAAADREAHSLIDQAVAQALRAGEIIRRTRELLKHGDVRLAKVELAPIIESAAEVMRAKAIRHRVSLVVRIVPGLPPVLADALQIEQVLLNLIRNSIDALSRSDQASGEVVVSAALSSEAGLIEIRVRDTGPGFSPDIAGRLFTALATTKETGMGLGLSISRSIVEAHGGRIWAEADNGRGADIRLLLPIYSSDD